MIFLKWIANFLKKNTTQYILLFFIFLILTTIFLNIPITKINNQLPEHIDAHLVTWIWSWEDHILFSDPMEFFNANIFTPFKNTLAYTETMLGSFLLAWPIIIIFNNPILAYSIVVLLTFAISGLGMYLLVYYLTKNKLAALLSALIYAFAPYKLIHSIGHLHLTGMWLPYVFLYLHKFFKYQSWKNIFLLTLFIILVFLTGFHYFIFLPIVVLVFFLVHYLSKSFKFNKDNIKKIILALFVLLIIIIPIVIPYIQLKQDYGLWRSKTEIEAASPGIIDYFTTPFIYNYLYNKYDYESNIVSPGWVVLLLFFLSLYILKKKLNYFSKNFFIYSIIGIIALLISFGFYITFTHGQANGFIGLYTLFYYLIPGFSGIRSVGRYSIFILLSLSIFIGYGINLWQQTVKSNFNRIILVFLVITLLFTEFAFIPPVNYIYPEGNDKDNQGLYSWVAHQPDNKIFLELPMGYLHNKLLTNYDIMYVFQSRHHFKKIVNGYSGYYSPGYLELANKLKTFEPDQDIEAIKKFKANYLIFHFDRYNNTEELALDINQKVKISDNIKYITNFGNNYVYEIRY